MQSSDPIPRLERSSTPEIGDGGRTRSASDLASEHSHHSGELNLRISRDLNDGTQSSDSGSPTHGHGAIFLCEERHDVDAAVAPAPVIELRWRMKDRMKTVSVALVLCLNIGVDPPDVIKISPCARMECWIDPGAMQPPKALEAVGKALQAQYERWQPRARYKVQLDPTTDEVKKLAASCRKNAKAERVLFHYNGHGVPRPTANGEIWVFNKSYTQYIPLSVYDLQAWVGTPAIYVFDCSAAGLVVSAFCQFAEQLHREAEARAAATAIAAGGPAMPGPMLSGAELRAAAMRDCILLGACGSGEQLPQSPEFPADLFTACLTTPIKVALRWFAARSLLNGHGITPDMVDRIPGRQTDRKTPLGELNWIFTAVTDTIAWNTLPRPLFQRLFRQDLLVASLFRNLLLAQRVLRAANCSPVSYPALPPTHQHAMWEAWDLAAELVLAQLPGLLAAGDVEEPAFKPSAFFAEQLTAFEVWLEQGACGKKPPEQLPIVLQVLLSQSLRLRALVLLGRFLDLGPWAVHLALSVGIFPYVLKLLQTTSAELRHILVFIWAKVLALDRSCQVDLVKDGGHAYFVRFLDAPDAPADQLAMSAFVLAAIMDGHPRGQQACHAAGLAGVIMAHMPAATAAGPPLLLRWFCLCLLKLWEGWPGALAHASSLRAIDALVPLLHRAPTPEVRAAAAAALAACITLPADRAATALAAQHAAAAHAHAAQAAAAAAAAALPGAPPPPPPPPPPALSEGDTLPEPQRTTLERTLAAHLVPASADGSVLVRVEAACGLAKFAVSHAAAFRAAVLGVGSGPGRLTGGVGGGVPRADSFTFGPGAIGRDATTAAVALGVTPAVMGGGFGGGGGGGGGGSGTVGGGSSAGSTSSSLGAALFAVEPMTPHTPMTPTLGAPALMMSGVPPAHTAPQHSSPFRQAAGFPLAVAPAGGSAAGSGRTSPAAHYAGDAPSQSHGAHHHRTVSDWGDGHIGPLPTQGGVFVGEDAAGRRGSENGWEATLGGGRLAPRRGSGQSVGSGGSPGAGPPAAVTTIAGGSAGLYVAVLEALHLLAEDPAPRVASAGREALKAAGAEAPHTTGGTGIDSAGGGSSQSGAGESTVPPGRRSSGAPSLAHAPTPGPTSTSTDDAVDYLASHVYAFSCGYFSRPLLDDTGTGVEVNGAWIGGVPPAESLDERRRCAADLASRCRAAAAAGTAGRVAEELASIRSEGDRVLGVLFDPLVPWLYTADSKGVVQCYDYESGVQINRFRAVGDPPTSGLLPHAGPPHPARICYLELMNEIDAPLLLVGADDGTMRVWRKPQITGRTRLATAWAAVPASPTLPPSSMGAIGGDRMLGDRGSGARSPPVGSAPIVFEWHQEAGALYASGGEVPCLRVWAVASETCADVVAIPGGVAVTCIGVGAGALLTAGTADGALLSFDMRHPARLIQAAKAHAGRVLRVLLQPGGAPNALVSGCATGEVKIYDLRRMAEPVRILAAHTSSAMTALAAHRHLPILATGAQSQCIKLFSLDGEPLSTIRYHNSFLGQRIGPISCLRFHPLRHRLAAGTIDAVASVYSSGGELR